MDLDGTNQEDLHVAKSMVTRCRKVSPEHCQLFSYYYYFLVEHCSNILLLSLDCCYVFRSINHNIGVKGSACIHHIVSAALQTITSMYIFLLSYIYCIFLYFRILYIFFYLLISSKSSLTPSFSIFNFDLFFNFFILSSISYF